MKMTGKGKMPADGEANPFSEMRKKKTAAKAKKSKMKKPPMKPGWGGY